MGISWAATALRGVKTEEVLRGASVNFEGLLYRGALSFAFKKVGIHSIQLMIIMFYATDDRFQTVRWYDKVATKEPTAYTSIKCVQEILGGHLLTSGACAAA